MAKNQVLSSRSILLQLHDNAISHASRSSSSSGLCVACPMTTCRWRTGSSSPPPGEMKQLGSSMEGLGAQPRQGDGHWWLTHKDRQLWQLWAAGGVCSLELSPTMCVDVWMIRAILVEGKGFSVKLRPRNLGLKQFFSTGIQPLRHWSSNYGWRKANKYIKLYGKMASEQGMGAVLSPYEKRWTGFVRFGDPSKRNRWHGLFSAQGQAMNGMSFRYEK